MSATILGIDPSKRDKNAFPRGAYILVYESRDNKLLVYLKIGEFYSMLDGHKCGRVKNRARRGEVAR